MTVLKSQTAVLHLLQKSNGVLKLITPATSPATYHNAKCNYSSDVPVKILKNPTTASLKRGTGGRSSFNGIVCTIFGNTGFIGGYVCNRLGKIGTQLILPYRGDIYDSMRLKLMGDLGQILFHPFHLCDEDSIRKCIKYSNVVINLIGRDWETKNFSFNDVHVEGARRLARLCREANVERFIHVSHLNASPDPEPIFFENGSELMKAKWMGEQAVREEFPDATIIRPSYVYGQEDKYLWCLTSSFRKHLIGGIPMWEKGEKTIKAPLWVGDVASGIREIVLDPSTAGKTYQFLGPKRYYLGDLAMWVHLHLRHEPMEYGYRKLDIKYYPLFKLKVSICESMSVNSPLGYLHWEGLEKEHLSDNPIPGIPGLEDLGVKRALLEDRINWELGPFKLEEYYTEEIGEHEKPTPPNPVP
ncbi:NADH dehydrogenase [ubiquinone] 1 alpha subcomplex subunit 9, mitochondrial [Chelonus insularis]|uniref:NADH dehydrogenase [ubiquinone] 1 alpha subcomplex subunit 9, mitochondrial n=1 Tax=Chelonus insularis TaxID=460826 RepID=UPI001589149F|nr:NADH dehydrogenase [ubiquinone] 1 alpha subcomplex subunit 9, mitochondrial [Chelonus insularis]